MSQCWCKQNVPHRGEEKRRGERRGEEGQNVATVHPLCIKLSFSGNITTEEPHRLEGWAVIWQEQQQGKECSALF